MNLEKLLPFLIEKGVQWVESQREEYRSTARDLTEVEKAAFAPFFDPKILEMVRIKTVPVIENPDFYSLFQELNIPKLLDFNNAVGITFRDTIVSSQRFLSSYSLLSLFLFHELVHVVQYEVLGVRGFINRYARGWAENGLDYYSIPLEVDAYNLEKRYETNPKVTFSVLDEVLKRLGEKS